RDAAGADVVPDGAGAGSPQHAPVRQAHVPRVGTHFGHESHLARSDRRRGRLGRVATAPDLIPAYAAGPVCAKGQPAADGPQLLGATVTGRTGAAGAGPRV